MKEINVVGLYETAAIFQKTRIDSMAQPLTVEQYLEKLKSDNNNDSNTYIIGFKSDTIYWLWR